MVILGLGCRYIWDLTTSNANSQMIRATQQKDQNLISFQGHSLIQLKTWGSLNDINCEGGDPSLLKENMGFQEIMSPLKGYHNVFS